MLVSILALPVGIHILKVFPVSPLDRFWFEPLGPLLTLLVPTGKTCKMPVLNILGTVASSRFLAQDERTGGT